MAARLLTRFGRIQTSLLQGRQHFATKTKLFAPEQGTSRIYRQNPNITRRVMAPASGRAISLGKWAVAGASAFALGSLFYYGSGLSKNLGAIDTQVAWSEIVRQRVKSTYIAFGGSIIMTVATVALASRFPLLVQRVSHHYILNSLVLLIGSNIIINCFKKLPYKEEFGTKHLVWMTLPLLVGTCLCPIALVGGAIVARAAAYTVGIVGGLSTLAFCAPSEKYLYIGGPLAMGLGAVLVASIGSVFVPTFTTLGSGLYSVSLYGGLVVFGTYLLYHTQKIIYIAKRYPLVSEKPYDPLYMSMGLYANTVNIFVRILEILGKADKK